MLFKGLHDGTVSDFSRAQFRPQLHFLPRSCFGHLISVENCDLFLDLVLTIQERHHAKRHIHRCAHRFIEHPDISYCQVSASPSNLNVRPVVPVALERWVRQERGDRIGSTTLGHSVPCAFTIYTRYGRSVDCREDTQKMRFTWMLSTTPSTRSDLYSEREYVAAAGHTRDEGDPLVVEPSLRNIWCHPQCHDHVLRQPGGNCTHARPPIPRPHQAHGHDALSLDPVGD